MPTAFPRRHFLDPGLIDQPPPLPDRPLLPLIGREIGEVLEAFQLPGQAVRRHFFGQPSGSFGPSLERALGSTLGPVAGFGADVATDPLTFLPLAGPLGRATGRLPLATSGPAPSLPRALGGVLLDFPGQSSEQVLKRIIRRELDEILTSPPAEFSSLKSATARRGRIMALAGRRAAEALTSRPTPDFLDRLTSQEIVRLVRERGLDLERLTRPERGKLLMDATRSVGDRLGRLGLTPEDLIRGDLERLGLSSPEDLLP